MRGRVCGAPAVHQFVWQSVEKTRFGGGGCNAGQFHCVHTMAVDQLGNVYNRRLEIEIRGNSIGFSLVGVALVMRSIVPG